MIRFISETGSTSADLAASLRAGERVPEGDWLVADRQTAGRGRMGRAWLDGAGNFMGSTLVHLAPGDPPAATLALVAGLALREVLAPHVAITLKWPNDVLVGRAKLAGILLERQGDAVIVGMGVNLASAPTLPDRETAALGRFATVPARDAFAHDLQASLITELARWRTAGLASVIRRWQAAAHPEGTPLRVEDPAGGAIEGAFAGLAEDGALQLRLADGALRAIHAGEVLLA